MKIPVDRSRAYAIRPYTRSRKTRISHHRESISSDEPSAPKTKPARSVVVGTPYDANALSTPERCKGFAVLQGSFAADASEERLLIEEGRIFVGIESAKDDVFGE